MSTKSSSKFWKKLGLGKKASSSSVSRPQSLQSHATDTTTTLNHHDDDQSVKSKRFSGVLPHRKQSTNSMKRLHQMTAAYADTPALPSATHTGIESKQAPDTTTTILTPTTPLPSPQPNNTTTLGHHVEQTHQANHVNSSTPPLDPDLGKLQDDTISQAPTRDDHSTGDQPCFTALESNMKSCSTDDSIITHSTTDPPTRLTKRKSSASLKKTSKSPSSSASTIPQATSQTTNKSRLRQPTRTNSSNSTAGSTCSVTPSASSSLSSLKKDNTAILPPPPLPTLSAHANLLATVDNSITSPNQKDQLIQQLQEALQTEQSINQVLQGQKEAITRDLDYFSLTVDELMEEKESLVQKYEEEKLKAQSKEEDLNVLLDKLKASTDNARERSMEVDQWKTEIENLKEELSTERNELKAALKRKDQEIARLKNELSGTEDEIKTLSSQLNQISQQLALQEPIRSPPHPPHSMATIETPGASPRLDAQKYSDNEDPSRHTRRSLSITTAPSNILDNELMALTKEKEKLQSDYSKIPISGGGPTSRRRKEQLEEMLDEVDSQLSKVKQKIRRS